MPEDFVCGNDRHFPGWRQGEPGFTVDHVPVVHAVRAILDRQGAPTTVLDCREGEACIVRTIWAVMRRVMVKSWITRYRTRAKRKRQARALPAD